MIHGLFYRNATTHPLQKAILDGSHSVLNIDPIRCHIATWFNEQCWLAQSIHKPGSMKTIQSSDIDTESQIRIVAWARLDNREELASILRISPHILSQLSDKQLILRAYLQFGENCTKHLYGDFCFAIYDQPAQKIFCARDQMGARPFYYYANDQVFVFSSSLSLFHVLECVPVKPCMEWAVKFLLANLSMDFHKTAYHHIFKLPPANQLSVTNTVLQKKPYFAFHTHKMKLSSSEDYVALYEAELVRAIKNRIQTEYPLGSEMSGGLDSSTVTAYAAKYFEKPLSDFYTFSFAHLEKEPYYILQVNQQYNISNSYVACHNPRHLYDKNRALQALGGPVEHGTATHNEIFYDIAAKHQVRTLLSGFGGDEFVTSIHGGLYLYELLKHKQYLTLYNTLLGNPLMRALRFIKFYYGYRQPGKMGQRIRSAFDSRWPDVIIADDLTKAYALKEIYEKAGDFDNDYDDLDRFTLEKRWAPFVATRMENGTLMAATYGLDYRWPLLDTRLIQCFLSIPSSEKFYRGIGRYLHKRAVDGTVPKDIVWQKSKYMGEPVNKSNTLPTLNNDLHPDLLSIIQLEKLKKQVLRLPEANKEQAFQLKNNIMKVNQLDDWLKYFFPQGCDWENTPDHVNER